MLLGALVGLIVGIVVASSMSAAGGGRFAAIVGLVVLGTALGAFTAITFGPQVGAALGVTVGYVAWMALMGVDVARTGIDVEALKNRFTSCPDHRNQQGDARVAAETDAARDRVLAARAALGEELETLEASARAAVDVPAKIRRDPRKTAAIAGGAAFVVLGGPRRVFRRAKRAVTGPPEPFPKSMLPDEIEKTLRELGDDGAAVRGALERDFAAYAKQASRDRARTSDAARADRRAAAAVGRPPRPPPSWLFRTDDEGFQARLAQIRERTGRQGRRCGRRREDGRGRGRPGA